MIWHIARKEFLLSVITLRFAAACAVCGVVSLASGYALVQDYEQRLTDYSKSLPDHRSVLSECVVYSDVTGWADRPPSPLSFLAIGSEWEAGAAVLVDHIEVPVTAGGSRRANPLLAIFADVDPKSVVQLLVSLVVLLVAYDSVCGERERGTLPLTFASAVRRPEFLLAKYLGGMMAMAVPVLLCILLPVAVASGSPSLDLDRDAWFRIGILSIAALAYASVIYLLGLVVSIAFRRSNTALVVLFFAWILLVVVVPDGSAYLASRLRPTTSAQVIESRRAALSNEFWGRMYDYTRQHPGPREAWDFDYLFERNVWTGDLPYCRHLYYAPAEVIDWYRQGMAYGIPLRLQYEEQRWQIWRAYLDEQRGQARLARLLASLSPAWTFGHAAESLANTDAESGQRFLDQARAYRQELLHYIEGRNGLGTLAYFTRLRLGEMKTYAELKAVKETGGQAAVAALARPWTEDLASLTGVPEFRYRPEGWQASLTRVGSELALLLILNATLFLLAHALFLRQDLRQTG